MFTITTVIFTSLIFIEFILLVTAQLPVGIGSCPNHRTVDGFDLERFQGTWYEIERSFYVYELLGHCPKFNFTLRGDNNLDVKFSMRNRVSKNQINFEGTAFPNYDNNAIWDFKAKTSSFPARMMPGSGKYLILYTDYDKYAIMWSCSNLKLFHIDLVWILSRTKTISTGMRPVLYEILNDLNINIERLTLSKQSDC